MVEDANRYIPLPIGSTVGGKYTLARVIGSGGMGAVYEAKNSWTRRRVAIKVLLAEHAKRADVIDRFTREARATTEIAHPNIVDVLDMGQDADTGVLFIVQEFLDGMDLSRWLEKHGRCSPSEALGLLAPVMGALVAAHRRGVIHRDLKPENIFLAKASSGMMVPKLIDFGISKFIDASEDQRSRTATGMAVGTPQYMSPEQARGDRDVDARSDVWSMGVVLYELLSGALPFDAPNYNMLIVQVVTQRPTRIETMVPALPQAVADVLHRAIEPDRALRFQSMQEFLAALLDVVGMDASAAAYPSNPRPDVASACPEFGDDDATRVDAHPPSESVITNVSLPKPTMTPPPWSSATGASVGTRHQFGAPAWLIGSVGGLVVAAVLAVFFAGTRKGANDERRATATPVTLVQPEYRAPVVEGSRQAASGSSDQPTQGPPPPAISAPHSVPPSPTRPPAVSPAVAAAHPSVSAARPSAPAVRPAVPAAHAPELAPRAPYPFFRPLIPTARWPMFPLPSVPVARPQPPPARSMPPRVHPIGPDSRPTVLAPPTRLVPAHAPIF